jgi:hypothetical protein
MLKPGDITWIVTPYASKHVEQLRADFTDDWYWDAVADFTETLCAYFNADGACQRKQGRAISPMGCTLPNAKALKIRVAEPGGGQSGGLRVIVTVFCDRREVHVKSVRRKRSSPKPTKAQYVKDANRPVDQ